MSGSWGLRGGDLKRATALGLAAVALCACSTFRHKTPQPAPAPVAQPTPAPAEPPRIIPPPPAAPPAAKTSCVPRAFPHPPKYPDTDGALREAGGAADRYQLMAAGRLLRIQRLTELERVLEGCR